MMTVTDQSVDVSALHAGRVTKPAKGSVPAPPPQKTPAQPSTPAAAVASTDATSAVSVFAFDTPSPDDAVTAAQQRRTGDGPEARPPPAVSKARGGRGGVAPMTPPSGAAARQDTELRGGLAMPPSWVQMMPLQVCESTCIGACSAWDTGMQSWRAIGYVLAAASGSSRMCHLCSCDGHQMEWQLCG